MAVSLSGLPPVVPFLLLILTRQHGSGSGPMRQPWTSAARSVTMRRMNNLLVQSAVVPFAVSMVTAGILRLLAGSTHGPAMAGAATTLAFIAGFVLILGAPTAWPAAATQKIFFIAIIGGIFGLALDLSREARHVTLLFSALAPAPALIWLGWPHLVTPHWSDVVALALIALAGGGVLTELQSRNAQPAESCIKLLVAAMTLALIALIGASAVYAQLCGVLTAAAAGFLFWLWPFARCRFTASAIFGIGLIFIAVAGAIAVFTPVPKPALGLLLPIFFADRALGRFDTGIHKLNHALRPFLLGVIALIPAIAAIGLAHLISGSY